MSWKRFVVTVAGLAAGVVAMVYLAVAYFRLI